MIAQIVNTIFYIFLAIFLLYTLLAIYALLRFGRTKIIGIVVSLVFLALSAALYVTALIHISNILNS